MISKFNTKARIITLLVILIGLFSNGLKAQYYAGGQSPGSLKWKQINSSNFQIIFPEGFENYRS